MYPTLNLKSSIMTTLIKQKTCRILTLPSASQLESESLLCGVKHKALVCGPLLLWIQPKCSCAHLSHSSTGTCAPTWPLAAGGKLHLVALQKEVTKYKVGVRLSEATLGYYVRWAKVWSQSTQVRSPPAFPVPVWPDCSLELSTVLCYDGSKLLHAPNFCHVVLLLFCRMCPA